jgi:hypothetical protein
MLSRTWQLTVMSRPCSSQVYELAKEGGEVSAAEIARGTAGRRRHAEDKLIRLDYFLPVPGRTGLLTPAFAAPVEPPADPLAMLFDAIAESLRWRS